MNTLDQIQLLDSTVLKKLLNKICHILTESPTVQYDNLFNEQERRQLISSLKLPTTCNLLSVVRFCFDFLHSSALKDSGELLEKLDPEKHQIFVEHLKTSDFKKMCESFKQSSMHECVLSDIRCLINMQFLFENTDKKTVELNHAQLYEFYDKLECIQNQLDSFT